MCQAGRCVCGCRERMHSGQHKVAIRTTMGCVHEQNPTVASRWVGHLPATPSSMQALGMAASCSTFSFNRSMELLCGISSSFSSVGGPACSGKLCTYVEQSLLLSQAFLVRDMGS